MEKGLIRMRKIVSLMILFGLIGFVPACSGGTPPELVDTAQPTTPSAAVSDTPSPEAATVVTAVPSIPYNVIVNENPSDGTKSDIYVKNSITGEETFFITLTDIYRAHYHNAEYHNGNLYIIQRTGGDDGYLNDPNWTDELWRYNQQNQGQLLFSLRGLDFRISADEQLILINSNEKTYILNNSGDGIKTFQNNEVSVDPNIQLSVNFLAWGPNAIWLSNLGGATLSGAVKVDTRAYSVTKYSLSGLGIGREYAFNPDREIIAFSDYPIYFDAENAQTYENSGKTVHLTVYDLITKTQHPIATSITKLFAPEWIDANTLAYDDPGGTGRLTAQIP
jgi:hypothetical protein